MMDIIIKLPDDIFRQHLLQYLVVHDVWTFEHAYKDSTHHTQILDKISGAILIGDKEAELPGALFAWMGKRRVYMMNMVFSELVANDMPFIMKNMDQKSTDRQTGLGIKTRFRPVDRCN